MMVVGAENAFIFPEDYSMVVWFKNETTNSDTVSRVIVRKAAKDGLKDIKLSMSNDTVSFDLKYQDASGDVTPSITAASLDVDLWY